MDQEYRSQRLGLGKDHGSGNDLLKKKIPMERLCSLSWLLTLLSKTQTHFFPVCGEDVGFSGMISGTLALAIELCSEGISPNTMSLTKKTVNRQPMNGRKYLQIIRPTED